MHGLSLLEYLVDSGAIIGFTDGLDNGSQVTPEAVLATARQASIPIFLIGVGSVEESILQFIAEGSGGLYVGVDETSALEQIYANLSGVLNHTYVLSYPTQTSGTEAHVEVTARYVPDGQHSHGQSSSSRIQHR